MKSLLSLFGLKYESPSSVTEKNNSDERKDQYASEVILEKEYQFMYENFIVSSQSKLYLLLEKKEQHIEALTFDFSIYKYGYPNDEAGLPSCIPGVVHYGLSEVFNSKWVEEIKNNNRSHDRHSDEMFSNRKHYVVRFKDVTLEVIALREFSIEQMTLNEFQEIINQELDYISHTE